MNAIPSIPVSSVSVPSVTKQAYTLTLAKRAASDPAALAMLENEKSRAEGFAELLQVTANSKRVALSVILSAVPVEDIVWLMKSLPQGPRRDSIREAQKSIIAGQPATWELFDTGEINVGKEPSKCAMIVATPIIDGKKAKQMKGLKFWRWIASLTDSDREQLNTLLATADSAGMK